MPKSRIEVPYNHDLEPLEDLLRTVVRPGDYFVVGSLEAPMPRLEVEGAGLISFPVPAGQIHDVIRVATRAPYGRGEDTILDESVRRVWQVPADRVKIGGGSWNATLARILGTVASGLGCAPEAVQAELYKLLVYDEGGFFKVHRDTEKAGGMFGTMVIVLPCPHEGGELVIRHAGRATTVELSTREVSELRFAAFYADCEHEVLPVRGGNRVCLIYNLIQRAAAGSSEPIRAPLYDAETKNVTGRLQEAFGSEHAPAKLAWLLDHQYSPDGLAFAALKGADVARAALLRKAAEQSGCVLHLALVHIEETGPAEPNYRDYSRYRSRYGRYGEPGIEEEDVDDDQFEVVEVSEASRFFDQWRNQEDEPVEFGSLPLEDGELLPAGALDGEKPDEQRLTEATGNEGATFERSYHRAALVLWPRERFVDVLLQSGVGAALPLLTEQVARVGDGSGDAASRQVALGTARRVVEAWESAPPYPSWRSAAKEADRGEMVRLLGRLREAELLGRFIEAVVVPRFDGSEAGALAEQALILGPGRCGSLFHGLVQENGRLFHRGCVALLHGLVATASAASEAKWKPSLTRIAEALVTELPKVAVTRDPYGGADWPRGQKAKPVDSAEVVELVEILRRLGSSSLQADAVKALCANPAAFDPVTVVVPALRELRGKRDAAPVPDDAWWPLWKHAAEFLLARSEQPPAPPKDWQLEVRLDCTCEDCRELQAFALDPVAQVYRFRVRQDRRQHLHGKIERFDLDMTHVTERKGSPQSLVCTKTRRTHQRRRERHAEDCAAMGTLVELAGDSTGKEFGSLRERLERAKDLKSVPCS
jgi:hypothetical protein